LIGQSSGYIESLPEEVKQRIATLEEIHGERAQLECKFRQEVMELERKYHQLYAPLYQRRSEVIAGKNDNSAEKGIPEFWLTCFKNSPGLEQLIQEHDEEALKKLVDVRLFLLEDNPVIVQ
jgi:nucleosome assembly protein 1-like 1